MRLLVTGATGLLGVNAVLDQRDRHEVTALHRSPLTATGVQAVRVELTDADALAEVFRRHRPELVLHTAAIATLEACEQDPARARAVNVDVAASVAGLAAAHGSRLVHVSTDAVFDGTAGPYRETDLPHPLSTYAATKLDAEREVLRAHPEALVARVNFFGWSGSGRRSLAEFFVNALAAGTPVHGFTDVEFGSLYTRDLVDLLVEAGATGLSGVFHVVSTDHDSKFGFGRTLARTFELDEELVRPGRLADLASTAVRSHRLTLDPSAFATALGRPLPTLADGLARMRQDGLSGWADRVRDAVHPT